MDGHADDSDLKVASICRPLMFLLRQATRRLCLGSHYSKVAALLVRGRPSVFTLLIMILGNSRSQLRLA